MARIRSTHAEQWVDDQFVTCSPLGRLLAIGVRNFADDNGAFEWKPIKMKMQILPADNCDINGLLDELLQSNQIIKYSVNGGEYGLIRNFRKYQKPKKPSCKFPKPSLLNESEFGTEESLNRYLFGTGSERVGDWWENFESEGIGIGIGIGIKKRKPVKPALHISPDWQPGERSVEMIQGYGVDLRDAGGAIADFRRWAAESGTKRKNWDLVFQKNPVVKTALAKIGRNSHQQQDDLAGAL